VGVKPHQPLLTVHDRLSEAQSDQKANISSCRVFAVNCTFIVRQLI